MPQTNASGSVPRSTSQPLPPNSTKSGCVRQSTLADEPPERHAFEIAVAPVEDLALEDHDPFQQPVRVDVGTQLARLVAVIIRLIEA
jgi:hypothetical protein